MTKTADTLATMERHWQALVRGDVPALLADYAEDAVLITGATGVIKGREAIGEILSMFVSVIIPAVSTAFRLDPTHAEAALGYIIWISSPTFVIKSCEAPVFDRQRDSVVVQLGSATRDHPRSK